MVLWRSSHDFCGNLLRPNATVHRRERDETCSLEIGGRQLARQDNDASPAAFDEPFRETPFFAESVGINVALSSYLVARLADEQHHQVDIDGFGVSEEIHVLIDEVEHAPSTNNVLADFVDQRRF